MADVSIRVRIGAVLTGLRRGLNAGTGMVKGWASSIKSVMGGAFGGLAGLLTVAAASSGIKNLTAGMIEIDKRARQLGTSSTEIQKLQKAAALSAVEFDDLVGAIEEVNIRMEEASRGSGSGFEAFQRLGLDVDKLKQLGPVEILAEIARALNSVENAADRISLADQIFGGDAFKIMGMIRDFGALNGEIQNMADIIDEKAITAAVEMNKALQQIKITATAMVANSGLVPWLADVASGMKALSEHPESILTAYGIAEDRITNAAPTPDEMAAQRSRSHDIRAGRDAEEKARIAREALAWKAQLDKEYQAVNAELAKMFGDIDKASASNMAALQRANDAYEDQLRKLREKLAVQNLINAGMHEEAEVLRELQAAAETARANGTELTVAQSAQIEALVRQNYRAALPDTDDTSTVQAAAGRTDIFASSLDRIGGGIGKVIDFNTTSLDRDRNATLQRIEMNTRLRPPVGPTSQVQVFP